MSKTIWKFHLPIQDSVTLEMPAGAKVLHIAATLDGALQLWAEVEAGRPVAARTFLVYGTGFAMPDDPGSHVATVVADPFVWHVYESETP